MNGVKDKMREHWGENDLCLHFPSKYSHFVCSFLCVCSLHLIRVQTLFINFVHTCCFVVDKKLVVMSKAWLTLKGGGHCLHSHWLLSHHVTAHLHKAELCSICQSLKIRDIRSLFNCKSISINENSP